MKFLNVKKLLPFILLLAIAAVSIFYKIAVLNVAADDKDPKLVALTFDDGPGKYTEKLLDGLRERDVKASFFVLGTNAESNKDMIERMFEEGHLIGNHTYNHVQLTTLTVDKACDEINKTNNLIYDITGKKVKYIRPPFGVWSEDLECMNNMTTVMWNVDPLDWSIQNTNKVVKHVLKNVTDGSIILLHDTYGTSVDAALKIVDELKKQGYEFVTIDKMVESYNEGWDEEDD